jgi:O-antigen/teichoic acid export membrane protein
MLMLWYYSKWIPLLKFNIEKFKEHFNFGYKLTLSGLLDTVFNNAYHIIIGKFFPPAQVGFYYRAKSMQMYPVRTLSTIMGKVTYPLFAQIQDDNIRLKNVYKKILQLNIFVLAPTLIVSGVLAEPIFRFLFTEKWLTAATYFQILIPAGILYPIHSFNLNILKVKGRSDLFLKLEIIKKIIITLAIIVGLRFGIYGLLYATIITSFLAFFINTHYSGKFINYSAWKQIKDMTPVIVVSVITGLAVFLLDLQVQKYFNTDIVRIFSGGITGVVVFLFQNKIFKMESYLEIKKILTQTIANKHK